MYDWHTIVQLRLLLDMRLIGYANIANIPGSTSNVGSLQVHARTKALDVPSALPVSVCRGFDHVLTQDDDVISACAQLAISLLNNQGRSASCSNACIAGHTPRQQGRAQRSDHEHRAPRNEQLQPFQLYSNASRCQHIIMAQDHTGGCGSAA